MVKRNPPLDRDKVKIASFRISEGEWFDFSEEADRQNVTATDVLKGSIRLFMAGTLELPEPIEPQPEPSPQLGSVEDVERFVSTTVNTAISKLSILSVDQVTEIARGEVERALQSVHVAIESLQSQLAEVKADDLGKASIEHKTQKPDREGGLTITQFYKRFDLGRPDITLRMDTAVALLAEHRLDSQWEYQAKDKKFYPIGEG